MKVIFRKDKKTGEVMAFFPETYNEHNDYKMTGYTHIGQHFDCVLPYYWETVKASPEEYAGLYRELVEIVGYEDLQIRQRMQFK